jgi:hypothetical protein
MSHVNIAILTPGHSLMGSYVESLLATGIALNNAGLSWTFCNQYASHVADAREMTLSGTPNNNLLDSRPFQGQLTYDKLMWIDSDISWKPEDVLKLYHSDKDVTSGAYLLPNGVVTAYPKQFGPGFTYDEVIKMTEPSQVDGIGFGFVCVKPGIFENLSRPWFQSVERPLTIDGVERIIPIIGEDLSWCARVKDLGYEIWLDPSVKVTHHKMMKLTWEGIQP